MLTISPMSHSHKNNNIFFIIFQLFTYLIHIFVKNNIGEYMNNEEYDLLVKKIIKNENSYKNIIIAFLSGGFMGLLGEFLSNLYIEKIPVTVEESYLYVFITFIILGSIMTGLGFFDKILSIFKCGLIVPSTGFANTMTSSAMDTRSEGFVKGIGASIFKLTGSIILYGVIFGILFGFIRGVIM